MQPDTSCDAHAQRLMSSPSGWLWRAPWLWPALTAVFGLVALSSLAMPWGQALACSGATLPGAASSPATVTTGLDMLTVGVGGASLILVALIVLALVAAHAVGSLAALDDMRFAVVRLALVAVSLLLFAALTSGIGVTNIQAGVTLLCLSVIVMGLGDIMQIGLIARAKPPVSAMRPAAARWLRWGWLVMASAGGLVTLAYLTFPFFAVSAGGASISLLRDEARQPLLSVCAASPFALSPGWLFLLIAVGLLYIGALLAVAPIYSRRLILASIVFAVVGAAIALWGFTWMRLLDSTGLSGAAQAHAALTVAIGGSLARVGLALALAAALVVLVAGVAALAHLRRLPA